MPGYPGCTDVSGSIYFHSNRSSRLAPAHQGMKIGMKRIPAGMTNWGAMAWYNEYGTWRILRRPTPTPAGDKPPRYICSFRHRPSVYNSARFARGKPASRLIGGHIFVPMTKWAAGSTRLAGVTGTCRRDGSRQVAEQIDIQSSHL